MARLWRCDAAMHLASSSCPATPPTSSASCTSCRSIQPQLRWASSRVQAALRGLPGALIDAPRFSADSSSTGSLSARRLSSACAFVVSRRGLACTVVERVLVGRSRAREASGSGCRNGVIRSSSGGSGSSKSGDLSGDGGGPTGWSMPKPLLWTFYAAFVYYAAVLSPNLTFNADWRVIGKLVGLIHDGVPANTIVICEVYGVFVWSIIYTLLLVPSGRSDQKKGGLPVWPFLVGSVVLGGYALLPYYGLWRTPPGPAVTKEEVRKFPLSFLENKRVSYAILVASIGLVAVAAFSGPESWAEFHKILEESRMYNVIGVDFCVAGLFAPFWVHNDIARRTTADQKPSPLLLPLSFIPFIGPALYLASRPPLPPSRMMEEEEAVP